MSHMLSSAKSLSRSSLEETFPFEERLIASPYKIACEKERLAQYLTGRPIYPLAVEFDLTDKCNRSCPGCPSIKASTKNFLTHKFIDRLLGILEGHAHGLLFTGGEPTIAPLFAKTLKIAGRRKFKETAVVTNGKCLDSPGVTAALLEHVTALRISLYDWEQGLNGPLAITLKNISRLRRAIDCSGSPLSIGVSVLTDKSRVPELHQMVAVLADSGAHWVYFHPRCENWEHGRPAIVDQAGVEEEILELQRAFSGAFPVFYGAERYSKEPLRFSRYHAANFLLVIGADGKNYLSPETKYNQEYVLADPGCSPKDDFLWEPARLARMGHSSGDYRCIASRHRTVLYNGLVEKLITGEESLEHACSFAARMIHPYIL